MAHPAGHTHASAAQGAVHAARDDFPVSRARRFLEPGPIVLVSSHHAGRRNVMTLGWHMVLEFTPSLVGLMISAGNHSFEMIRKSGECVINVPTAALADTIVGIGNTSGRGTDKFAHFGLTAQKGSIVEAPLIGQCPVCFECCLHDDTLVAARNLFIVEVVKAHAAVTPEEIETLHYTGGGIFRRSGGALDKRALFRPEMLEV
ncbi:flavin reductase family protein [Novosphingobium terrae]|uniref:flavin reductase family protein n=1 Tax=Novosphingobium terrae TaxID=2726189 RepID=UPI00197EB230|nr:flavin reductase family protein [Novosphingobium terrae]